MPLVRQGPSVRASGSPRFSRGRVGGSVSRDWRYVPSCAHTRVSSSGTLRRGTVLTVKSVIFFQLKVKLPFLPSLVIFTSVRKELRYLRSGGQEVKVKVMWGKCKTQAQRAGVGHCSSFSPTSFLLYSDPFLLPVSCSIYPLLFLTATGETKLEVTGIMLEVTKIITNNNLQICSIFTFVQSIFIK